MPGQLRILYPLTLLLLMLSLTIAFAGETGKIAGIVLDRAGGEPLAGANVIIEGTNLGGTTDERGEYFVINIPPGTYDVTFMYIGYQTIKKTGVRVSTDLTTRVDADLSELVMESDEIVVVTAERNQVQKDLTASEMTYSKETIEALPVRSISDIVSLQAGVVKDAGGNLHIRGGRTTEIAYMVDGVQVIDPLNRRSGISIDDQSIEELKTITGTFNAEYGQALSGVINQVTKRGSDRFEINVIGYFGDHLSFDDDVYYVMDNTEWANAAAEALMRDGAFISFDLQPYGGFSEEVIREKPYLTKEPYLNTFNPLTSQDLQVNISGPLPFFGKRVTYFASARYNYSPGYSHGKRYFKPWGVAGPALNPGKSFSAPDNEIVPLNWYRGISSQSKLFIDLTNRLQLSYGFYYNDDLSYGVNGYQYKYVPDAGKYYFTESILHLVSLKHVLSPSTFYEFKGSHYSKDHKNHLYEDPFDYRYIPDRINIGSPNINDFRYFGNPVDFGKNNVAYTSLNIDMSSQVTKRHFIKTGVSARLHDLKNDYFRLIFESTPDGTYERYIPGENSPFHVKYSAKPREFAAYIQDKIEFRELIINIGMRYDYFDPAGRILADPAAPELYDPVRKEYIYKNYTETTPDSELVSYTDAEREAFWFREASAKSQLSPRFGLSFPISDEGVIHFSYGHFFQNPEFRFLYDNPNFWITGAGARNLVGNADLNAERTVMYEVGLQQQLTDRIYMHVTGFYRDIRDWIGTGTPINTYKAVTYYKWENKDHAEAKGITLSGNYRASNLSINMDYTFMTAKGTSSNPQDAYTSIQNDEEPQLTLIHLDWDQQHSLSTILIYSKKGWMGSVIGTINSGLPYTPAFARGEASGASAYVGLRENSARKPIIYNVDLRLSRAFDVFGVRTEAYLNVRNLFDIRSANNVYSDTGQPDYTLTGIPQKDRDNGIDMEISDVDEYFTNPGNFTPPRFIQLGFKLSR